MDVVKEFEKTQEKRTIPDIRPGDIVEVHEKIIEGNKERVQVFKGTIIAIRNGQGINGTFTVRRVASGVGVEKIFPFHLPSLVKLKVNKRTKVRRAKLFYLRRLQQKAARLQEKKLSDQEKENLEYRQAEPEEAKAEEKSSSEKSAKAESQTEEKKKEPAPKKSAPADTSSKETNDATKGSADQEKSQPSPDKEKKDAPKKDKEKKESQQSAK